MKILEILGLKKPEAKIWHWSRNVIIAVIILAVLIIISAPVLAYEISYRDKIFQGVFVDGINVGGMTKSQALDALNRDEDNIKSAGLNFIYENHNYNQPITAVSPTDPDLAFEYLDFQVDQMVDQAYSFGRKGTVAVMFSDQLKALLAKKIIPLEYNLNESELTKALQNQFGSLEKPGADAKLVFADNGEVSVSPDADGFVIDYSQALAALKNEISLVKINPITLQTKSSVASVRQAEAEKLLPNVREILNQGDLTLKYTPKPDQPNSDLNKSWQFKSADYKNWLAFAKTDAQVIVQFSPELMASELDAIASEIDVPPQDAKFQMTDNKVTEFVPALPGLELDRDLTLKNLNQEFINNKNSLVDLAVKESEPANKTADSNSLGIKELIGVGVSDFANSHVNRIKNIMNAVKHLNGIIIPPGEFSTVDAIGDVNADTGYFPEFVIKGDRTLPEYGGGLCQIGTTMFRAALYSGLPITERKPHSYIVSYYKPLGMDATIYGPHPDLRFNNDTGNNILLQIKVDGTKLTFEFWGSSDGRKVEITDPVVYNRTPQPPDRLIENPELKPGDKVKKETGRGGADTYFYRHITKGDGSKIDETFRSHYIPWPNIYEVGVSASGTSQTATDTTATDNTAANAGSSGSSNQNTNSAH